MLMAVVSCIDSQELQGYHDGILPRDSMVTLMLEVQLVESYRNLQYIQGAGDSLHAGRIKGLYDEVFDRYKITAQRFDSSYNYYQNQDPVILDAMYTEVNQRLSEELSKIRR